MAESPPPLERQEWQSSPEGSSHVQEQQSRGRGEQGRGGGSNQDDGIEQPFVAVRRRSIKQSILPPAAFLAPKRRASSAAVRPVTASSIASQVESGRRTPEAPLVRNQRQQEARRDDSHPWHDDSSTTEVSSSAVITRLPPTTAPSQTTQVSDTSGEASSYPPRVTSQADLWKHGKLHGRDLGDSSAASTLGTVNDHAYHAWSDETAGANEHTARPAGSGQPNPPALPANALSHPYYPPGFDLERPKKRNYAKHKGANKFLGSGLLVTADANPWPFIGSLALVVVLGGLWFGFEAPYYWRNVSPAVVIIFAYLWLSVLVNMLVTAWKDPGIVPRDLDPDPLMTTVDSVPPSHRVEYDPDDPLYTPMPRMLRIRNGQDLVVKWCETCKTYRPPRSSHCRTCDNCVDLIDHHCNYLNTCIGRRNYVPFFAFLVYSMISSAMIMVTSAIHLHLLTLPTTTSLPSAAGFGGGMDFEGALRDSPITAVLFLLMIGALIPVCTLFGYHTRLIVLGRTTAEQIRINTTRDYTPKEERLTKRPLLHCTLGIANEDPNPFAYRNPFRNVAQVLFRPAIGIDSYIARRGWIRRDTRVMPLSRGRQLPSQTVEPDPHKETGDVGTANATGTADQPYGWSTASVGDPRSSV